MRADQDIKPTEIVDEAVRLFSLDQPSLRALSYVLRHRETWPKWFVWDYTDCRTCAQGLAVSLWTTSPPEWDTSIKFNALIEHEKVPYSIGNPIFWGYEADGHTTAKWRRRAGVDLRQVTPEMVADQIDKYLAGVK